MGIAGGVVRVEEGMAIINNNKKMKLFCISRANKVSYHNLPVLFALMRDSVTLEYNNVL